MLIPGIATGLCAAFFSALSYLATRYFTHTRTASTTGMLLIISHVHMGVVSMIALPIMLYSMHLTLPPMADWIPSLLIVVSLYLIGHTGLLMALRNTEPSRVSPMMALKLIMLASLSVTLGHQPLSVVQWIAVGLCVIAGVSLNYSGGKLKGKAIIGLTLAVVFYSLSDWNVKPLINSLGMDKVTAGFVAFFMTYVLACFVMVPLLFFWGSRKGKDWVDSIPFSFTWFTSVAALYTCFALAGPVFGNIMQSTRGVMSVGIAAILAKLGHFHLEGLTPRSVMIRRVMAAVLMMLAIAGYSYEKDRLEKEAAAAQRVPRLPAGQ